MFRALFKGATLGLVALVVVGVCPSSGAGSDSQTIQAVAGKKQAYMGDPTIHRGMELGWDRGYLAAKTDQQEGLAPDLGRHALYHDPNPMYRYEFGKRSYFYSGFRSGFLIGYRQGWDKTEVPYVAPKIEGMAAGMESEMMIPGAATDHRGKTPSGPPASDQALSDAF